MKQVIIIRKDLNMRKGKMVAQGAHASMAVFFDREITPQDKNVFSCEINEQEKEWIHGIFTKICLGINSEDEILEIYNKAKDLNLPCSLIEDCGKTEFNNIPTITACAIGPSKDEVIDTITGHLKLL